MTLLAAMLSCSSHAIAQDVPPAEGVSRLPGHQLCTPDRAAAKQAGAGTYRLILPANPEWGVIVPNPTQAEVKTVGVKGKICWDPGLRNAIGCNGPEGSGVVPNGNFEKSDDFLAAGKPAGALVMKSENGRTLVFSE
jgi:hypothetical protein